MKSNITIYHLCWETSSFSLKKREDWFQYREGTISYDSTLEGEKAAEEAFELTNAPLECLSESQQELYKTLNFKGRSLSVGDVVRVDPLIPWGPKCPEYYLCKSFGWEKFEGDTVKLIGYLG
jgi:hypothetical protein